jgi:hypothetical protein
MKSFLGGAAFVLALVAGSPRASAYGWMIRHGYPACATCHEDPSGAGLLTPYGRAQGVLLMSTRWGSGRDDEAAARLGEFLFGAVHLPDALSLGGEARGAELVSSVASQGVASQFILMQTDLDAGLHVSRLHAEASLGYAKDGAYPATLAGSGSARLVSRTHWIGVDLGADHDILLRAGRIDVPFGLRIIEHTAWVRAATRTDINASQEHGLALAFTGSSWRGEAMAIAGNYQLHPDAARERGLSGTLEYDLSERVAFGASTLVTHAREDVSLQTALWRQAHGLFARASPAPWLVLMGEADFLLYSQPGYNAWGLAGFAQADIEPVQGLHLMGTFECQDRDVGVLGLSLGGWLGVAWFFAPHADVRLDGVVQSVAVQGQTVLAESALAMLHFYL